MNSLFCIKNFSSVGTAVAMLVGSSYVAAESHLNFRSLNGAEIQALLADQSLFAGENAEVEQIFQKNGNTFHLENGASSFGTWRVANDLYCSTWPPNPTESCFHVEQESDHITFISKSGQRYDMRLKK